MGAAVFNIDPHHAYIDHLSYRVGYGGWMFMITPFDIGAEGDVDHAGNGCGAGNILCDRELIAIAIAQ
ncbi:hypothetical protein D3C87_2132560 [compost metagenome]